LIQNNPFPLACYKILSSAIAPVHVATYTVFTKVVKYAVLCLKVASLDI